MYSCFETIRASLWHMEIGSIRHWHDMTWIAHIVHKNVCVHLTAYYVWMHRFFRKISSYCPQIHTHTHTQKRVDCPPVHPHCASSATFFFFSTPTPTSPSPSDKRWIIWDDFRAPLCVRAKPNDSRATRTNRMCKNTVKLCFFFLLFIMFQPPHNDKIEETKTNGRTYSTLTLLSRRSGSIIRKFWKKMMPRARLVTEPGMRVCLSQGNNHYLHL